MAKRFVAVLVTLCAVLAALCLSGCAEEGGKPSYQLVSEGKLTVAMAPNFPPFDSLDGCLLYTSGMGYRARCYPLHALVPAPFGHHL